MKAQRRHELQQSDLAKAIKQAPSFWQQSGGKYLLAAVAVLAIALLIRYRISSNRDSAAHALESLATARNIIEDMQSPQKRMMSTFAPPGEVMVQRKTSYNDAKTAIDDAVRLSDERSVAAEALLARGDLNWGAANLPELPGAATQPSLNFRDPKELTTNAAEAYKSIVDNYSDLKHAQIAARFGLAAIAENRGNFDEAKAQYEKIAAATNDIGAYQQLASQRLRILDRLKTPVILAAPATEPVKAATTSPALPPLIAAPVATTQATVAQPAPKAAAPTTAPATPIAPTSAPSTKP